MADQDWGTNIETRHAGATATVQQRVQIRKIDFSAGPNAGEATQAHGLAAITGVLRAWVQHTTSGGDVLTVTGGANGAAGVHVDATNLCWNDTANLSGDTGVGYIEYVEVS